MTPTTEALQDRINELTDMYGAATRELTRLQEQHKAPLILEGLRMELFVWLDVPWYEESVNNKITLARSMCAVVGCTVGMASDILDLVASDKSTRVGNGSRHALIGVRVPLRVKNIVHFHRLKDKRIVLRVATPKRIIP